MLKFVLFLLMVSPAWAVDLSAHFDDSADLPGEILITSMTRLRSSSFYRLRRVFIDQSGNQVVREALNTKAFLNPGTRARILNINTNHQGGVGLEVRVTSGPHQGLVGWIYFNYDPDNRNVELVNGDEAINVADYFDLAELSEEQRENISPQDLSQQLFDTAARTRVNNQSRRYISNIWNELARRPDLYTVNMDEYDGGDLVPIDYRYRDANGIEVHKRFYGSFAEADMINLPLDIQRQLLGKNNGCTHPDVTHDEIKPEYDASAWVKGCHVLADGAVPSEKAQLKICLENIQKEILNGTSDSDGRVSREAVFENLYRKLNPVEQRFAAMIFTAAGESGILAPPNEEMIAIMKVLDNRKRETNRRWDEEANVLDIALQRRQFSFYNSERVPANEAWRRIIVRADMNNHPQINNAIEAYLGYEDNRALFSPRDESENIYHYYSTILDPPNNPYGPPSWIEDKTPIHLAVNEEEVNGFYSAKKKKRIQHKFYAGIRWSYNKNAFRRTVEAEQ